MQQGDEKSALYTGKSPLERLSLQSALVRRLAALHRLVRPSSEALQPPSTARSTDSSAGISRAEWPGEIFDIDERNCRLR